MGRSINIRLKGHQHHIHLVHLNKSAVAEHSINLGHSIQLHNTFILAKKLDTWITSSGRRLRLNSIPTIWAERIVSVWASRGNLSSTPWGITGSLLSTAIQYDLCEVTWIRSTALADWLPRHLWSANRLTLVYFLLPVSLRIHLLSHTGPCTLLPSSWFLLARPRSQVREQRANEDRATPFPLTLWSLYNCYPDWQLILPSHLLSLVSCSVDFLLWRWRWYVPPKCWFIYGLHPRRWQFS
jgi:hypothetical protein